MRILRWNVSNSKKVDASVSCYNYKKRYSFCSVINLKPSFNSYLPLFSVGVFVVSMYFGCVFNCFQRTALFLRNMYLVVSASQELLARHMLAGVDLVAPG